MLLVITWIIFIAALIWTNSLIVQCIALICHAINDKDFKVSTLQVILPALFWGLSGYLISIG